MKTLKRIICLVLIASILSTIIPSGVYVYAKSLGDKIPTTDDKNAIKLCEWLSYMPDDRPVTLYEDHASAPLIPKKDYLSHFFNTHNSSEGQDKYSNKLGMYAEDKFIKEGELENESGSEGDPKVKLVFYSTNYPPFPPSFFSSTLKKVFCGTDDYKSETRYGWIHTDFIGDGDDPTDAIIYSNVGCTNFYANIDANVLPYEATSILDYELYGKYKDEDYLAIDGGVSLLDKYYVRTGRIVDLDENGFPFIHYVMYCDFKDVEGTPINGTVTWIDGNADGEAMAEHKTSKELNLTVKQKVGGSEWENLSKDSYKIEWNDDNYAIYKKNDEGTKSYLPSKTDGGDDISYKVTSEPIDGFEQKEGENAYDIKYVRMIEVYVTDEKSDGVLKNNHLYTIDFYQNGEVVGADRDLEKSNHKINDVPIADDNNIPYQYKAVVTPLNNTMLVKTISSKYNDLVGTQTIVVGIYDSDGNVKLPVELENEGVGGSDTYYFMLRGMTDVGELVIPDLILTDSKLTDNFVIPNGMLTEEKKYEFAISQIAGDNEGIKYDSHTSYVNVTVAYEDGKQIFTTEWIDSDDQAKRVSLFKNGIKYTPVKLNLDGLKHESVVKVPAGIDSSSAFPRTFTYKLLDKQGENCIITLDKTDIGDTASGVRQITFDKNPPEYDEPGKYTLYVACDAPITPGSSGWDFDTKLYSVDFEVALKTDKSGLEIKNITYETSTIQQIYSAVKYQIPVEHKLVGQSDGTTFEFNIEDMFGPTAETLTITGEGKAHFPSIKYYAPGTYYYKISETKGTDM